MRQSNCSYRKAVQWYLGWTNEDVNFCFTRLEQINPTFNKKAIGDELLGLHKQAEEVDVRMAAVKAVVLANRVESIA